MGPIPPCNAKLGHLTFKQISYLPQILNNIKVTIKHSFMKAYISKHTHIKIHLYALACANTCTHTIKTM